MSIEQIGDELAIRWDPAGESYIRLEELRRHCPCAGCRGEVDVMGNLHIGPAKTLLPEAFRLVRLVYVGNYAIQPVWGDGHSTGIYSYDYLMGLTDLHGD